MEDENANNWETEELLRWILNDEGLYRSAIHVAHASKDIAECATHLKLWLDDVGLLIGRGSTFGAFLRTSFDDIDWLAVAETVKDL